MALSEIEIRRIEKIVGNYVEQKRPPPHIRPELDIGYRIEDQSVVLFEVRPAWREPSTKIERLVAKFTFVKAIGIWKIYWQRADLKWHRYEPYPEADDIEDFLKVVEADAYGCFWG